MSVEEAEGFFRRKPFEDLGYAKLDSHRRIRSGAAEVVFSQGKDDSHLTGIFERIMEKKLASIATVLSVQNRLLLLDEPSIALDPRNRRNLIDVVNSLSCAKLIASHDLDFIYDTCPRTILLLEGKIACMGETHDILRDKSLLEAGGLELPLSFSRV